MEENKENPVINEEIEEFLEEPAEDMPSGDGENDDPLFGDIEELRRDFPELSEIESVTELSNPIRYAALRDIGLSPAEAYILTSRALARQDNRAHLTSSVPKAAKSPDMGLSKREIEEMRQIFGDISDADIYKLYKKVTK